MPSLTQYQTIVNNERFTYSKDHAKKQESFLSDLEGNSQFNYCFAIKRMPLPSSTTPLEIDEQYKLTIDDRLVTCKSHACAKMYVYCPTIYLHNNSEKTEEVHSLSPKNSLNLPPTLSLQ